MTFLRAAQTRLSDAELARTRERFVAAAAAGEVKILSSESAILLGYAVARTDACGRTALTHTTPMPLDEAAHELRQCRKRGGIYTLIELRQGGE